MEYIRLSNVTKKYGGKVILEDINLRISTPGIIGVIGPNGAGKTTLFRLITNLINKTNGKISIFGKDIRCLDTSRISYCSDSDSMYEDLSGYENLEFIVNSYGIDDANQKIKYFSECLNITNDLHKTTKSMSKGMRKKISIIRALLIDADIYMFDEPMSFLDFDTQLKLTKTIRHLSEDKLILISNHNLNQLEQLCDKVIIINRDIKFFGNIMDIDTGDILKLRINFKYENQNIEKLIGEIQLIEGVIFASVENEMIEIEYNKMCNNVEIEVMKIIFQKYKILVNKINHIEKKLEDLYHQKVKE